MLRLTARLAQIDCTSEGSRISDFREELYGSYVTSHVGGCSSEYSGAKAIWWGKRIVPLLKDLPRDVPIAELGCGSGVFVRFLVNLGFSNVVGVDISGEQVAIAEGSGLPVRQQDALAFLDGAEGEYGAIVAFDFLEHFTRDELTELVPSVYRALRPGGRLIAQTINLGGLSPGHVAFGDLTHMTLFNEQSLSQLLRHYQFRDIGFFETGPVAVGPKGVARWLLWRLLRFAAATRYRIETGKTQGIWTENQICVAFKSTESSR